MPGFQAGASWRRLSDRRSPPVACLAALRLDTSTARTTAAGVKAIGRRNCAYNRSPAGFIAMSEGATYSAVEVLRDKRRVKIRALRPDDRADLLAAVGRTSEQSLYRRFFAMKGSFTEPEIAFFLNIDFVNHVALVAVLEELGRPRIVGGGRYIVVQPRRAEVAFVVVDQYQRQGIGSALLRHLATLARRAGIDELIAEVLPDNTSMLKVLEKSGFRLSRGRESQVVHVTLHLV